MSLTPSRLLPPDLSDGAAREARSVVDMWLASQANEGTVKTYRAVMRVWGLFASQFIAKSGLRQYDEIDNGATAALILGADNITATQIILAFRVWCRKVQQAKPRTIDNRVAVIRSLCTWSQDNLFRGPSFKSKREGGEAYNDTIGLSREEIAHMLVVASQHEDGRLAARDVALLALMYSLALRRSEVASVRLRDLSMSRRMVSVKAKRRTTRVVLSFPQPVRDALARWLSVRGPFRNRSENVFLPLSPSSRYAHQKPFTQDTVYAIVTRVAAAAGLVGVTPHTLRHSAITHLAQILSGDYKALKGYSRHRDIRVAELYDNRRIESSDTNSASIMASLIEARADLADLIGRVADVTDDVGDEHLGDGDFDEIGGRENLGP